MKKEELIRMMGDEDKANWAMEKVLENVKADFVIMCLKATAEKADRVIKEKTESGYYKEFSQFPEYFNLWTAMANDDPLAEQWDKNRAREIEEAGDRMSATFAKNMYVHAVNHR